VLRSYQKKEGSARENVIAGYRKGASLVESEEIWVALGGNLAACPSEKDWEEGKLRSCGR